MNKELKLTVEDLKINCGVDCLKFETTKDLEPFEGLIGQEKAAKALDFGLDMKREGYNIYVAGESGTGRSSYSKYIASERAEDMPVPSDWLYVNNFKNPHSPIAIQVAAGEGKVFVKEIERIIEFLKQEIKQVFTSKDYENTKRIIKNKYEQKTAIIIENLNVIGKKYGFRFTQNERGLVSIPLKDGEVMSEEEYKNISDEEYQELKENSEKLSLETVDFFNQLRRTEQEYKEKLSELAGDMGARIVTFHLMDLREKYKDNKCVQKYFDLLVDDIVDHIDQFDVRQNAEEDNPLMMLKRKKKVNFFDRYRINLFLDNSELEKAPVVVVENPTYYNLVGSVEYKNEMGVMKTDFMHIKAGKLHKANGGFLIIHAKDLLSTPYSWNAIKRAIKTKKIKIENIYKQAGVFVSTTLEPEAIDLDIKIIIIGDKRLYSMLYYYDDDFRKYFKIMADYDHEISLNEEAKKLIGRFIATQCEEKNIKHFTAPAVGKVIEFSSRVAGKKTKLSSQFHKTVELLYEAEKWAEMDNSEFVKAEHVKKALDEKRNRTNLIEGKIIDMFKEETYLLDIDGEKVGEINGLAVVGTGHFRFGKPSKISVSTYRGKAGIINIEREAQTSGKIHDKGVMILTGYLGQKFAQDKPLNLNCSIVFEQMYSGVDGDSASSTELYAILSSLSEEPIRQGLAVTGSVNQRGFIQPIGGVNEKIEGYFRVCKEKGLTGDQGVLIPHQNVKNLMLNDEVIEAVEAGEFTIYSITTIEEGIEVLTGVKAGIPDENGDYPEGTIFYKVNEKLKKLGTPIKKKDDKSKSKSKESDKKQ